MNDAIAYLRCWLVRIQLCRRHHRGGIADEGGTQVMDTKTIANIKACKHVYRASDVARHYEVHRSTVKRIWDGQLHIDVTAASDFPDIAVLRRPVDLTEDIDLLIQRGLTPHQVAQALGISERSVWLYRGVFV